MINNNIKIKETFGINTIYNTIGNCWIDGLKDIISTGIQGEEITELHNYGVSFCYTDNDNIIQTYSNSANIEEMKKVFFSEEDNIFGHSYKKLISGPYKQKDLSDVIKVLKEKYTSNRAILLFENTCEKQPCINCIHFKLRNGVLNTTYFARGQDFFKKFYCDAVCISLFDSYIKKELGLDCSFITAFISSAHIYNKDIISVHKLLEKYHEDNHCRS